MAGSEEFKHESYQDRVSIVKYLEALCDGVSNGRIVFGNNEKQIVLEPKGLLKFDVKAKRKDEKQKVTLKISWSEEKISKDEERSSLIIEAKDA